MPGARGHPQARRPTGSRGYRGLLEVDYLVDATGGELFLGELNPRISGISSMTNVSASAYADMPLFLFHLLEYMDVDYEIDVDDINRRWSEHDATDVWSQLVLKQPEDRGASRPHRPPASGASRAWTTSPSVAGATTGTACRTTARASICARARSGD